MSDKLFDDLARALATPMPRGRVLRLLGATLVAAIVPAARPTSMLARSGAKCDAGCGDNIRACPRIVQGGIGPPLCCGWPATRYGCGGNPGAPTCIDRCAGPSDIPCPGKRRDFDGCIDFLCCKRPESIGCEDGECIPNCKWPNPLAGRTQCGKQCCEPGDVCKNGKCEECPDRNSCKPAKGGTPDCCPKGTKCCRNNTTATCCGPDQECRAAGRRQATCRCKQGVKCGTNCCDKDETCCNGEECCGKGEVCCGGLTCCENCCGGIACCDQGDWCLYKNTGTIFNVPVCKPSCAPGNRCGSQCCGTGYACDATKKRCVRE